MPPAGELVVPTVAVGTAYRRLAAGQAGAWIAVVPEDQAMARARRLEAEGSRDRALWGVPFAVKDNIDVAGMPTTAACPAFAYVAGETAPAVQRLLDAGAILVGKTNLDQFATGLVGTRTPYGTCHSVLDPRLIAGGSSVGSAVAVGEGVVPFALGTDTAGSGRVPAACNGIVGLKPSRGLVSTRGVVPACRSVDCVSIFARSVAVAVAVLDVLTGADDGMDDPTTALTNREPSNQPTALANGRPSSQTTDQADGRPSDPTTALTDDEPSSQTTDQADGRPSNQTTALADGRPSSETRGPAESGIGQRMGAGGAAVGDDAAEAVRARRGAGVPGDGRWRIGVPDEASWGLAPAQAAAYAEVVGEIGRWATVREVDLTPLVEAGELLYGGPFVAERLTTIGPLLARDPDAVHPVVRQVVSRGLDRRAVEVFADLHRLADLQERFRPLWSEADVDVLVCPTVPDIPTLTAVEADPIGTNTALGRWTNGVNLLDLCALTVPAGRRPDGLPGSVTLLAPAGRDHLLPHLAARLMVGAG